MGRSDLCFAHQRLRKVLSPAGLKNKQGEPTDYKGFWPALHVAVGYGLSKCSCCPAIPNEVHSFQQTVELAPPAQQVVQVTVPVPGPRAIEVTVSGPLKPRARVLGLCSKFGCIPTRVGRDMLFFRRSLSPNLRPASASPHQFWSAPTSLGQTWPALACPSCSLACSITFRAPPHHSPHRQHGVRHSAQICRPLRTPLACTRTCTCRRTHTPCMHTYMHMQMYMHCQVRLALWGIDASMNLILRRRGIMWGLLRRR